VAPYNAAAAARPKIPWWAAGTLVLLPIWAIAYVGTLERPPQEVTGVLATGDHVYAARCASCHGATGGGGSGHALADGEVLVTFPTPAEHIVWVAVGSDGVGLGNPYGDATRGRVVEGGMPAWGSVLTTEELIGVVLHERARLSGSDTDLALAEAIDHSSHAGELDLSGHLDPATVTVDEVTELLESAAHDLDSQLAAG
jgi:mono/diheme cytochrome c family protein